MERATIIQHLKDCGEAASLLGNAWVVVRADVVSEARKQLEAPDLVKVVRCRDCRFWIANNAEEGDASGLCLNTNGYQLTTDMNWFCADGERGE